MTTFRAYPYNWEVYIEDLDYNLVAWIGHCKRWESRVESDGTMFRRPKRWEGSVGEGCEGKDLGELGCER